MNTINRLLCLAALSAGLAHGAIVFGIQDPIAAGFPGDTVGWTLDISNGLSGRWLIVGSVLLTSDPAPHGLPATFIDDVSPYFLLQSLGPGSSTSLTVSMTIDPAAPVNTLSPAINVEIVYYLFDADPFDSGNPGNLVSDHIDSSSIQLQAQEPANTAVPEPGTLSLLAMATAAGACGGVARRRR